MAGRFGGAFAPTPFDLHHGSTLRVLTRDNARRVDKLLSQWGGEGPVTSKLRDAITAEHDAKVLRAVTEPLCRGWSLQWIANFLEREPHLLPPADYRELRLGRDASGGGWYPETVARIFRRNGISTVDATWRHKLCEAVEAVVGHAPHAGCDFKQAVREITDRRVLTEAQARAWQARIEPPSDKWGVRTLKAFLMLGGGDYGAVHTPPAEYQAGLWREHIGCRWLDGESPEAIADALDAAGVLTPSQQRALYEGRLVWKRKWTASTVRGLVRRRGKHRTWSEAERQAHRCASRGHISPLRAVGKSARAVADALNAAGVLTPSQQRARDQGRAPPDARWSAGSVLRLAA